MAGWSCSTPIKSLLGKPRLRPTSSWLPAARPTATGHALALNAALHEGATPRSLNARLVPRLGGPESIPGDMPFRAWRRFGNLARPGDDIFTLQSPRHFH